ncbi:VOC family protein [Rhodococcus sp. NPDC059968]|uniref:VOC family protein n=1 Tax=Rhodococcus sp. NPDC059968 TaxID=3347017 RepID=UPI00366FC53C
MTPTRSNPAPIRAVTGHVGINVTDLARSIDFYQAVFAVEVIASGKDSGRPWAFLGREGALILTLWQQSEGRFRPHAPGLHHLSFEVPTLAEVESSVRLLNSLEIPMLYESILPHAEGSSSGGVFFADPDGTRLEIFTNDGVQHLSALEHGEPSCGFF